MNVGVSPNKNTPATYAAWVMANFGNTFSYYVEPTTAAGDYLVLGGDFNTTSRSEALHHHLVFGGGHHRSLSGRADLPPFVEAAKMRLMSAIKLFETAKLTLGQAFRFAGHSKSGFIDVLNQHGVAVVEAPVDQGMVAALRLVVDFGEAGAVALAPATPSA